VRAVVTLSQDLGLTTVAEGIETADQRAALEALDCTSGQGYLFSRPVDAEAIRAYIESHPPPAPGA
jgi:EAL domain-containing protein (putative c-di-GMP-specific phosphodiesterase class I)